MTEVSAENAPAQALTPIYSFAGNSSVPVMLGFDPNITGEIYKSLTNSKQIIINGAFSVISTMIDYGNTYKAGDMRPDIRFDAYRSNTVYGESSSVQPPALQTLIIIKA